MPRLIEEEPIEVKTDLTDGPDKHLKPYLFHGMDLRIEGSQATATCPFCEKDKKFSISLESGLWRCFVCGTGSDKGGGNVYTFLNALLATSVAATTDEQYRELAKDRGILSVETLRQWGACVSSLSGDWLLPGYNAEGKLCQLYRWAFLPSGKRSLKATAGLSHGMFGPDFQKTPFSLKKKVSLSEGPWDGMAYWELMRQVKDVGESVEVQQLGITGSESASLLKDISVIGVPGCNIFQDGWVKLFADKEVDLLFDSDHPRLHCKPCKKTWSKITYQNCPLCTGELIGPEVKPPGQSGMRRAARLLTGDQIEKAKTIRYICWGEGGYDPMLSDGTDLRDILCRELTVKDRTLALVELLSLIQPMPEDWLPGRGEAAVARGSTEIECVHCPDWTTLRNSWRFAMDWTPDLDYALSVMLATSLSTLSAGDQLWLKLLGPPSCGKSTLCEAMCVNKKHVKGVSTLRGFHSGYRDPESGGENTSLITKVNRKCMVTKDGDTILQMPDRDRILSEARDLFDKTARSDYRNGMGVDWEGIMMTWILAGTRALKLLDQSALGARFIDFEFQTLGDDAIDTTLDRVINRACRTTGIRNRNGSSSNSTQHDPAMLKAMQLTGGYINTICEDDDLLANIEIPIDPRRELKLLSLYSASMRARPLISKEEERYEKELPYRLASQFARLSQCLAGVFTKTQVDEEVMRRVKRCAIDTSGGKTVDYAKWLFKAAEEGVDPASLSIWLQEEEVKVRHYLKFLTKIKVVEMFTPTVKYKGHSPKKRWRLTPNITTIYRGVHHA